MVNIDSSQKKNWNFDCQEFLSKCMKSSTQAYESIKELLIFLENPTTQTSARKALKELYIMCSNYESEVGFINTYFFSIEKLVIDGDENSQNCLYLLQLPSIFTPEDWSFTFYEGLARYPISEFHNLTLAELGCGNGWISIALAKRCAPQQIYGLDINPRAVICAKINLYLNGLDDDGNLYRDSEGKTLFDRIQFHVSDLLEYCLENKIFLDKVIGCIPQVLAPNTQNILQIVPENASDEALYALSNYCDKQGYIEDQFGLGLIARAVEESIETIKYAGKIILNLGGRPGKAVLNRLFTRRGFQVKTIWKTKIEQAGDTDILALVDIENSTSHRFEFFMGINSEESIPAKTAYYYLSNGGRIFHSLQVIEAEMLDYNKMKKILNILKKTAYFEARSGLDLTYAERSLVEEKMSFLANLAEKMSSKDPLIYNDVRGEIGFRRHIAEYFRSYWKIPITAKSVLVAPSREALVKNILHIYNIKVALLDKEYCKDFQFGWLREDFTYDGKNILFLESPKQCELLCKLITAIEPDLVVCALTTEETRTQDALIRLVEVTKKHKCRLVIDFSNCMFLTSTPRSNAVFEYLSEQPLPQHVTLICGLIQNALYKDLQIAFLLSENETVLNTLSDVAEFTYGRASVIIQEYYNTILFYLLNFHLRNIKRIRNYTPRIPQEENSFFQRDFVGISQNCQKALASPCVSQNEVKKEKNSVYMDYAENRIDPPEMLKASLFDGFTRQNIATHEAMVEHELCFILKNRYGILNVKEDHVIVTNGVALLFAGIAEYCALHNHCILFPRGNYNYFVGTCDFFGTNYNYIQTEFDSLFKITPQKLKQTLSYTNKRCWIYLNAPIVNPTGAVYSDDELIEIFKIAIQYQSVVILDSIFLRLSFDVKKNQMHLSKIFKKSALATDKEELSYVLLGGISKELSAGGVRIGFGYSEKAYLRAAMKRGITSQISLNIKYACKKLFQKINNPDQDFKNHLEQQRKFFFERARMWTQVLQENGWEVIQPDGGFFLVAKPTSYINKEIFIKKGNKSEIIKITGQNIHHVLYRVTGLVVNGSDWLGIPDHCRFVLSVSDSDFRNAIDKIKYFYSYMSMEKK